MASSTEHQAIPAEQGHSRVRTESSQSAIQSLVEALGVKTPAGIQQGEHESTDYLDSQSQSHGTATILQQHHAHPDQTAVNSDGQRFPYYDEDGLETMNDTHYQEQQRQQQPAFLSVDPNPSADVESSGESTQHYGHASHQHHVHIADDRQSARGGVAMTDSSSSGHAEKEKTKGDGQMDEAGAAAASLGAAGGGHKGPGTGRFDPTAFRSYSFFDPALKPLHKVGYKIFLPFLVMLTVLVVWGFVSIYWGSLYEIDPWRLKAFVVNGDPNGQIGQAVSNAIFQSASQSNPRRLGWEQRSPQEYQVMADFEYAVAKSEDAWLIVQIMDNATQMLQNARSSGNASWDPTQVVRLYYSQARNYQAFSSIILTPTLATLQTVMAEVNSNLARQYLQGLTSTAALQSLANAPQLIAGPVSFSEVNVRPFTQTVTIATTFVGLIYLLILAFNVSMALFAARQAVQPYLKLSHLIAVRFGAALLGWFICSLSFATLNLPFGVDFTMFDGNRARGFFAFFAFMFLGTVVLGLFIEVFLGMLGTKFIGFALVFLIIIQVSVSNFPLEALNVFYRYGYAMPFYNLKTAFIAIIYNQGEHVKLLEYWGILMAWLVVLAGTLPLWIWYEQRGAIRERRAQMQQKSAHENEMREQGRKSMQTEILRSSRPSTRPPSRIGADPDGDETEGAQSSPREHAARTPTPLGLGRAQ